MSSETGAASRCRTSCHNTAPQERARPAKSSSSSHRTTTLRKTSQLQNSSRELEEETSPLKGRAFKSGGNHQATRFEKQVLLGRATQQIRPLSFWIPQPIDPAMTTSINTPNTTDSWALRCLSQRLGWRGSRHSGNLGAWLDRLKVLHQACQTAASPACQNSCQSL